MKPLLLIISLLSPICSGAMATTVPGTVITFTASVTCGGVTRQAEAVNVVVVKAHKFRYAPSAASIITYRGTLVSYVYGGVRLVGILTSNGKVFKDGVVVTPERW